MTEKPVKGVCKSFSRGWIPIVRPLRRVRTSRHDDAQRATHRGQDSRSSPHSLALRFDVCRWKRIDADIRRTNVAHDRVAEDRSTVKLCDLEQCKQHTNLVDRDDVEQPVINPRHRRHAHAVPTRLCVRHESDE
jgi:hypothetical protein